MDESKYAQGVVSIQIGVKHEGRDCHVLIQDPRTPEGFSWVGGFFRPSGSFYGIAENIIKFQTGASVNLKSLRLKKIAYSKSAINDRWLANYCFFIDANPLDTWSTPQGRGIRVSLFDTLSFEKFPDSPPEKIMDYHGKTSDNFAWSINDGGYIGKRVAQNKIWK